MGGVEQSRLATLVQPVRNFVPSPLRRMLRWTIENALRMSDVTLDAPIFVWGVGRSGTFLVQDILSLHPDLCTVTRTDRPHKGLWGHLHHGEDTPEILKNRKAPHEGFAYVWQPAGIPPKWYGNLQTEDVNLDRAKVYERFRSLSRHWIWKPTARRKRVLDKAVVYIHMTHVIDALFPDARHVFCIRDPRAVVNSILKLWRFTFHKSFKDEFTDGFFAHLYPKGYEEYLGRPCVEILGWQVPALIREGFATRAFLGNRLIPFRFETLLSDAHGAAAALMDAAGLPRWPDLERTMPPNFPDYSPRWPKQGEQFNCTEALCFDSSELPMFAEVERMARSLGYAQDQVGQIVGPIDVEAVESA